MAEVIVALDTASVDEARALVRRLGPERGFYKVGLELYTRAGPLFVRELVESGHRVFLDLKLHDIPNTVAGAVRAASDLGVDLLTVHAAGGGGMLEAAREARGGGMRLLAVTVLTSMSEAALGAAWGRPIPRVEDEVERLALMASAAGIDGVVASAQEARRLRERLGPTRVIVTPGIRPAGAGADDQSRVASPAEAVRAGADYLVLGRAVTRAPDPAEALRGVLAEVSSA